MNQTINSQTVAKTHADEKARENPASTDISAQVLLGSLRLNLTQPECSDGGLNG